MQELRYEDILLFTDFFFPKWFADRVFLVYGGLFAVSVALLVIRLFR